MTPMFGANRLRDPALLAARVLLALLYVIFGWQKLTGFAATVAYFGQIGVPLPNLSVVVAVVMEFLVGLAIMAGLATRPLAVLLAIYTLATGFLGHHYWTMTGTAQAEAMINFYKNLSIMGGLFALYVAGAGRYSVDYLIRIGDAPLRVKREFQERPR
jgi:putative oxidoreductase